MAKQGGARPGAGRKPGTPNIKTTEVLAKALEQGLTPVEYMLALMRDDAAESKDRQWAAEKAAPYVHPRPSPLPRAIEIGLPDISTVDGIKAAIATVTRETAMGNPAPSEAQSLVAVIEAQRKAIETIELVDRIERLEAAQEGQIHSGQR
jgi:hypothetical protein